jgi:hypothetical protein
MAGKDSVHWCLSDRWVPPIQGGGEVGWAPFPGAKAPGYSNFALSGRANSERRPLEDRCGRFDLRREEDMYILKALGQLGPALVLLVLAWRIRQTVSRFREAGVTAPEHAKSLSDLDIRDGKAIKLLRRRGVLVDAGTERYYLDEAAYERWRKRRRIILAVMLGVVVLLGIVLTITNP